MPRLRAVQELCFDIAELLASVDVDAAADREDQPRDDLRKFIEAAAQQVGHECNRLALLASMDDLDEDGAALLTDSVRSTVQKLVAGTQLYVRHFGKTLREQVREHVR